ncbi:MAG TPA: Fic family protein [Candidatus Obscuribacterales bacterium]
MPRPIPERELKAIEEVLNAHPEGITFSFIAEALGNKVPQRTLQYRLRYLVDTKRAVSEGQRRTVKYWPAKSRRSSAPASLETALVRLSDQANAVRKLVSRPLNQRKIVGYKREFLDSYRPNKTAYLTNAERSRLHEIGTVPIGNQPAGTYARKILDRLLIDLSWNSSRLEGNTYTKLDTKQLIEFGKVAEGKDHVEAQMILNHKDAIEFLVGAADEIGFNRYTLLNLHALLANNLLSNSQAEGRLRSIEVGIEQSTFQPLAIPQLVDEYFQQVLNTAQAIKDPFEQSLFVMVQLPYLQPFDDVNKRVSRLAANIPLIKSNLIPLTFLDVPRDLYTQAILGVYELNRVEMLKDIYLWAYERSAERYVAAQQSLGEPDPFRLKRREELRQVIGEIVRIKYKRQDAVQYLENWAAKNLPVDERAKFIDVSQDELLALHEGNFARYKVRPSEFEAWQKVWNKRTK